MGIECQWGRVCFFVTFEPKMDIVCHKSPIIKTDFSQSFFNAGHNPKFVYFIFQNDNYGRITPSL